MSEVLDTGSTADARATAIRLVICFAVTMLLFWFYSAFTHVPIIHGDESGYLLNAAAIAGYRTDAYSAYYPGYSLPISLAFLGGAQPDAVYDRIQWINASLWGAAACFAYLLVKFLRPQIRPWNMVLVLAAALLYPAYPVFGSLALSENLFVPCVLLLAYILVLHARHASWGYALLAGVLVGVLTLCHPKGALIGVAAAMAMLVNVRQRPVATLLRVSMMTLVAVLLFLLLHRQLDHHLREMLNSRDLSRFDHYPGIDEIIADARKILTLEGLQRFLGVLSGQALYLVIGSVGIAFVGALSCVQTLRARAVSPELRSFATFSLFSVLGVLAFSVFFMKEGVRVDHVIYGRYTESALPPLLLLGALSLPSRKWLSWAAVAAAVLGTLVLVFEGNPLNGPIVVMNITAVDAIRQLLPGVLNVTGITIVGVVAILILRGMSKPAIGLSFVLLTYIATALAFGISYLEPGSSFRGRQHSLADRIKLDFPEAACVNYDMDSMSAWERNNYQFYLLPLKMDSVGGRKLFDCGDLLISSGDVQSIASDTLAVAQEHGSKQQLWIKRSAFPRWLSRQPPLSIPEGGIAVSQLDKHAKPGLTVGWYGVESWGAWSKPEAYMMLDTAPAGRGASLRFEYDLLASPTRPRTLSIHCGDNKLLATRRYMSSAKQTLEINPDDFKRAGCAPQGAVSLHILVLPAASAADLSPVSGDTRQLGIGLKRIDWVAH